MPGKQAILEDDTCRLATAVYTSTLNEWAHHGSYDDIVVQSEPRAIFLHLCNDFHL
jgi:hypothetical protein